MSQESSEQKYAHDRFDDVEPYTTQQGAHRKDFALPKGSGHLNAIILAGGVALAIGVGSFLWLLPSDLLNQAGTTPEETISETVEDEPQDPEETVEPEDVVEPESTAEDDGPESFESVDPDETTGASEMDEAESDEPVDYEAPIGVYNASTVQGHAASVAQELGGAGFNVPVADNWSGAVPASDTVYFSDNEATANAVAEELGATAIYEPSVEGVVVVLTGSS
ncbi:MAG TPA: LytR C-terminal domain-containing protein [Candidatus Yaniella excrementavium]|nr:LytR C-terminal domain-containing protein [Candidatus Yaniella excrementavium]